MVREPGWKDRDDFDDNAEHDLEEDIDTEEYDTDEEEIEEDFYDCPRWNEIKKYLVRDCGPLAIDDAYDVRAAISQICQESPCSQVYPAPDHRFRI